MLYQHYFICLYMLSNWQIIDNDSMKFAFVHLQHYNSHIMTHFVLESVEVYYYPCSRCQIYPVLPTLSPICWTEKMIGGLLPPLTYWPLKNVVEIWYIIQKLSAKWGIVGFIYPQGLSWTLSEELCQDCSPGTCLPVTQGCLLSLTFGNEWNKSWNIEVFQQ